MVSCYWLVTRYSLLVTHYLLLTSYLLPPTYYLFKMLTSDLLIYRQNGETIVPKKLAIDDKIIAVASDRFS